MDCDKEDFYEQMEVLNEIEGSLIISVNYFLS